MIAHVRLTARGAFRSGRLASVRLVRDDLGARAVGISAVGRITPMRR